MNHTSPAPVFEPLLCQVRAYDQHERPFTPVAHDLIVISHEGVPQIAKNASVGQIISVLRCSNGRCAGIKNIENDDVAALVLIRFEEDNSTDGTPPRSDDDWSQLWPFFDCCCNDEDNAMDFMSRLRQAGAPCHTSVSKSIRTYQGLTIECIKICYKLSFLDKNILVAHHFHKVNSDVKEMVRMVTCGLSEEKIEAILCKALLFLKIRSSESDNESPGGFVLPTPVPHPKAIICSMLECLEEGCRKQLEIDRKWIEKIESDVNDQRDPSMRKPKGLEINYVKLGETSIRLGEIRQKLQYLLSSVTSLEESSGLPSACGIGPPICDEQPTGRGSPDTLDDRLCHQWWRHLREVKIRLLGLKVRCQQHNIHIENLQERVKGILSIVSILLQEKENEWSHQAVKRRQQTSEYQLAIVEYQVKMLKQQELIAFRTKRDNTVMKVIAVLTALFLPGTFIATVFSIPIFDWGQENPVGPHFMTYWYFTAPITTVLVCGFSIWFLKMWYDDMQAEKRRVKRDSQEDSEGTGNPRTAKVSLESSNLIQTTG